MLKIPQKSAAYCAILLKGGHHPEKLVSILYIQKKRASCFSQNHRSQKTWFRLYLSSAIVSNLALETKNSMLSR
jgi:hydroxymethylpyrimidine/phosphomethylpyrimidine kinase